MKDVLGIVVTYNPDVELLNKNIGSICQQVHHIVIIDNGSENYLDWHRDIKYENITWIRNENNLGIAKALNIGFEYSQRENYEYAITFDQDTVSPPKLVEKLFECMDDSVALVGPAFKNRGINKREVDSAGVETVPWLITSASLTRVSSWADVGGYDEYLFIDCVDIDFCNRLRKHGYNIIRNNDIFISHLIGDSKERKFLWKTLIIKNHSAFRKYYIARNTIVLAKKEGKKSEVLLAYLRVLKQLLLVFLYETDKKNKSKRILAGIKDSFRY